MLKDRNHSDADVGRKHEKDTICPVCKKLLHKDNLVDMKSIVEDVLSIDGVRIVGCTVRLECDCKHRFDEEGFTLDEPHKLVAVVTVEFDETGKCVQFAITEILG